LNLSIKLTTMGMRGEQILFGEVCTKYKFS
jgi:hypothetical protein